MVVKESVSISRDPESIWNFWWDVGNDIQWRKGIIKAEWTSPPPYGTGSTGEHTHEQMGVMKWKVTRYDEGRSFEFIHTEGALKGSLAFFQVEPEDRGSRILIQVSVTGPLMLRFMMLFMGKMMRKGVREDLLKLKEILEN